MACGQVGPPVPTPTTRFTPALLKRCAMTATCWFDAARSPWGAASTADCTTSTCCFLRAGSTTAISALSVAPPAKTPTRFPLKMPFLENTAIWTGSNAAAGGERVKLRGHLR